MSETSTHNITCPLCEATCGLEVSTKGREVIAIKGDSEDVFSKGYLCPKAYSLKELDADPDRLRQPLIREGDTWREASWEEAFSAIERGFGDVMRRYGRNAVGAYLGNPNVHTMAGHFYLRYMLKALGTRNIFSATSVDQLPKQMTVALMYGTGLSLPIPDIERTDYMLVLGANPLVSNGSLMTAPDMRGRVRNLRKRGGKLVVLDPLRTRTAEEADEHHFIRPGGDAFLLLSIVHTLLAEKLAKPGRLTEYANGLDQLETLARPFSPEKVAGRCGIEAATIRRLTRDLATVPRSVVYGRMGTSTQEFGTLASWLVEVVNFLTGNLDREGGTLFTRAAAGARNTTGAPGTGSGTTFGRWKSRVRQLPEAFGELPVAAMAEEIETPGQDQIKAMLTVGGNPVLSTPNSGRLQKAFAGLEFMVSLDIYRNETTAYANVILPALSPLERSHYDMIFYQMAARNIANYSPAIFERPAGSLDEWEIMLKLFGILSGKGTGADPAVLDEMVIRQIVEREVHTASSPVAGRPAEELLAALEPRRGPERMLDFLLRTGSYGDGFGAKPAGLSLAVLEAHPHGVDLGPLEPRLPEVLRTASGKIELAPPSIVADLDRLQVNLDQTSEWDKMVLIGRRDLRSNNSWMHNLNVLVKGENRCTLLLNPADAARLGLASGEMAGVTSRVGMVQVPVEISPAIMPGVVSLPHGWGHNVAGSRLNIAAEHAGINSNLLTDEEGLDPVSGNAILNGIPVTVCKV